MQVVGLPLRIKQWTTLDDICIFSYRVCCMKNRGPVQVALVISKLRTKISIKYHSEL